MKLSPIPVVLALLAGSPAYAADEDVQAWAAATATIPAGGRLVVWLEAQTRFYDEASRFGQVMVRPGLGYRLGPNTTAFVGYAYAHTDLLAASDTKEHRIWQQLSFRLTGDGKGATLVGRSRLEQRFVAGSRGAGLRLRQQLRLTAPLAGRTRLVGTGEAFIAFNDTGWGQRGGFERLRSFAGISLPLDDSLALEPGYLNEYVRAPGEDRMNHVASITVNAVF